MGNVMDTITDPRRAPVTQALDAVGQHLADQQARIDSLEQVVATLRHSFESAYTELFERCEQLRRERQQDRERIRALDDTLDQFRQDKTRKRDLPTEEDFEVYPLATEYARFVDSDLTGLAHEALRTRRRRSSDDRTLEEQEAELARELAKALLRGPAPDRETLARLFDDQPPLQLDDAIRRAVTLRTWMAKHGARFDDLAEPEAPSDDLRLWASCRPGAVQFVVAPALMQGSQRIATSDGEPAGPWVYTTEIDAHATTGPRRGTRTWP
jgi:hypothetical protein